MKNKFFNLFTRNPLLKIISLGVAFFLWLVVVNYDDPTITKVYSMIPVELTNEDAIIDAGQVYELVADSGNVSINVKAKRSVHNSLGRDDFKATADLSRVDDTGNVPVEIRATRLADRIDAISFKGKNTVALHIENFREKQLNIQTEITGEPGEDYMVGSTSLDRNVVKVSGPESKVNEVASAGTSVDITGMTQDMSTTENIKLYDSYGMEIKSEDIKLSRTTVGVTVQLWKIKSVPVNFGYVGEPAEGYGLSGVTRSDPESVRVAGLSSAVENLNVISIPAGDVDISGSSADKTVKVSVRDYLPSGISLADKDYDGSITLTVGISKLEQRTIEVPVANIAVVGVPEGMHATVGGLGEVVAVKITGLPGDLEGFNPGLAVGIINVEDLNLAGEDGIISPGVYDAKVQFSFTEGVTDGGNNIIAQLILRNEDEVVTEEE